VTLINQLAQLRLTRSMAYFSADEGFDGTYPTNVVVRNNGSCLYVPPGIFKSTCKIDITWFPFDDQRCEMKFGSWTYDGFQVSVGASVQARLSTSFRSQLDLQLQDETGGDISSFVTNGEWDLLGSFDWLARRAQTSFLFITQSIIAVSAFHLHLSLRCECRVRRGGWRPAEKGWNGSHNLSSMARVGRGRKNVET
jgi:Neurotransmitter-gated ion-channel ligand binding domain